MIIQLPSPEGLSETLGGSPVDCSAFTWQGDFDGSRWRLQQLHSAIKGVILPRLLEHDHFDQALCATDVLTP